MSTGMSDSPNSWFQDLVDQALKERSFRVVEGKSVYNHKSCPGAEFEFVWTKLSNDLVTGNAIWSVRDVSNCVTLHKLQKLDPAKKDAIKIQIVVRLDHKTYDELLQLRFFFRCL